MKPIQEHVGWMRDDSKGTFACAEGWYVKGQAVVRGGILVSEHAKIRGGTIRGGTIWGGTIWGGTIRGGTIWGGTIEGGTIEGGTIMGGTIRGGTIWGGTIEGGTIEGGTIWGGTIRGGTIWGGTIRGGTIRGGTIRGGTPPYARCVRWEASIAAPGKIAVGCQVHNTSHWLRRQHPDIPWRTYCSPAEQRDVQACVRYLKGQAKYCDWKEE